ncbi:phosphatase PAP2 family protein [Mycolicibacter sinensis]|uniref:Phosphatidic acid phosphatase type 2/haloperoxidase domain-containing protein n=1 Tax=Mycolicibacter sinensis (strain JDM601) TaxID=875328 RepID=A0A1A2XZX4_MYCSD|nr:phosphatase PAP2 family protein [Mycolicibacter sinensis]OBH16590.1 hypothetical protein A5694_06155 [Mycolicibacter sinensis]OBI31305.1 hypothetical protein A5710_18205 [Mycolicibacter sinensis]
MRASSLRVTALASVAAAAAVYVVMLVGYWQGWGWLAAADAAALDASYAIGIKHQGWVRFWDGLSTVFEPAVFRLLAMVAVVVEVVRRRLRPALFLLVAVELSGMLTVLAKGSVDRPRPVTALAAATSSSFPSGHALGVTVGVGALLILTLPLLRHRARLVAVGVGVLVVAAVGVARVALNVHHPSDVLAGWALGWAYLVVWAVLLRPWQDDLDDQL